MGNMKSSEADSAASASSRDEAEYIKKMSTSDSLYLFGVNHTGTREILVFDSQKEKFFTVEPPNEMPIQNHMSAIRISPSCIYISGGIDKLKNEISPDLIEYNPITNSFSRLSCMLQPRYTHALTDSQTSTSLFAIGGRTYGEGINGLLRTCEQYDFSTNSWKSIAPISAPRCTFFTFEYRGSIFICGGFNGNKRRSESIERYDPELDRWELLDFKLNRGVECGSLHVQPGSSDEFIIFGGNVKDGATNECWRYNLSTKESSLIQVMLSKRVLQKSILTSNNTLYILGGDRHSNDSPNSTEELHQTVEKCSVDANQISKFSLVVSLDSFSDRTYSVWKGYAQANDLQIIPYNPASKQSANNQSIQKEQDPLKYSASSAKSNQKRSVNSFGHSANALLRNFFGSSSKKNENESKSNWFFSNSPLPSKRLNLSLEDSASNQNYPQINNQEQPPSASSAAAAESAAKEQKKVQIINESQEYTQPPLRSPFHLLWYIFGATKEQDFIGEIDIGLTKCLLLKRPKKLTLASHRSGIRLDETMSLFLCGGVSEDMSKIYCSAFRYFPLSDVVEVLPSMIEGRYTFSCVKKGNYIYALGGRTYGNDQHAILSKCERYNIANGIWEPIACMNYRRCSFMASCIENKIYVAGGYGGHSIRHSSFECYHEKDNRWELMGISLIEPVEASTLLNIHSHDSKQILILGGRSAKDDSHNVYSYDIQHGFDAFQGQLCGNIGQKRCLHKQIALNPDGTAFLLIGGITKGERIESFTFDPINNLIIQSNQRFSGLISTLDQFLFKDLQSTDLTLKRNLLL